MKIKCLEMGLMKIQAETRAESQAVCGILEILFEKKMPDCICNQHGFVKRKGKYLNWCLIPDGSLVGRTDETMKPGIESRLAKWAKLPWDYKFKPAK